MATRTDSFGNVYEDKNVYDSTGKLLGTVTYQNGNLISAPNVDILNNPQNYGLPADSGTQTSTTQAQAPQPTLDSILGGITSLPTLAEAKQLVYPLSGAGDTALSNQLANELINKYISNLGPGYQPVISTGAGGTQVTIGNAPITGESAFEPLGEQLDTITTDALRPFGEEPLLSAAFPLLALATPSGRASLANTGTAAAAGFATGGPAGAILAGGTSAIQQQTAPGTESKPFTFGSGFEEAKQGAAIGGLSNMATSFMPGLGIPGIPSTPGLNIPGFDLSKLKMAWPAIQSMFNTPDTPGFPPVNPDLSILDKIRDAISGITRPTTGSNLRDLAVMAGLGLTGYGVSQGTPRADLTGVFTGAPEETTRLINERIQAENARRAQSEQKYLQSRGQARQTLEQLLGQGSEEAFRQAIQGRQEQLNRQGLLTGPSGALDFALAQEAGNLRRQQLPRLMEFEGETQRGLEGLRSGGLEGELGLGRAGMERNFGLGDLQRSATLKERLLAAEREAARNRALIGAGGTILGYGLGGTEGARVGNMATGGGSLEDIFSPKTSGGNSLTDIFNNYRPI